ncbi:MAG: hypothetical protein R2729_11775 [Bryobacteraceae bacterium]
MESVTTLTGALRDALDQARDQALDQLTAAWQLHVARVEEQLRSNWQDHIAKLVEERFQELSERFGAELEGSIQERLKEEVERARSQDRRETARRLSEHLNAGARRLRQAGSQEEWSAALVDAAAGLGRRAAVFTLHEETARLERSSFDAPLLEIPLERAPALAECVRNQEPVVAAASAGEVSPELVAAAGPECGPRVFLFPIVAAGKPAALLYAEGSTDVVNVEALELVSAMASAVWEARANAGAVERASAEAEASAKSLEKAKAEAVAATTALEESRAEAASAAEALEKAKAEATASADALEQAKAETAASATALEQAKAEAAAAAEALEQARAAVESAGASMNGTATAAAPSPVPEDGEPVETPVTVLTPAQIVGEIPPPAATTMHRQPTRPNWADLPPDEQDQHLKAQRFARVQVAEIRLFKSGLVKRGRAEGELYKLLREDIDRSRQTYEAQFLHSCTSMVDYLHLELVRTLANEDPEMLGGEYPGPLA